MLPGVMRVPMNPAAQVTTNGVFKGMPFARSYVEEGTYRREVVQAPTTNNHVDLSGESSSKVVVSHISWRLGEPREM